MVSSISYNLYPTYKYLANLSESLRLSSLIPQYTKVCTFPTIIQLNEFKRLDVEDGMTIMIPNYQFHHDKQYFPEPEAFKPERFDNGAYQELMRKGIFIPFSDGPRICMGKSLATCFNDLY